MATRLAANELAALDPYKFMAVIGKRVIHPGGRASTESLLRRAGITATTRVLDVGCGVGTTAIEITQPLRRHRDRGGHLARHAGTGGGQREGCGPG